MNQDRIRNKCNRKSKRVILVSYEGINKTERNYINNFSNRNKNYVIKIVPGLDTDPVNLIKQTIKRVKELGLNLKEDDIAFCIFDADTSKNKDKKIKEAMKLAEEYNINAIISIPSVEIWILLHYEYTTGALTNTELINKLRKYYPNYEKNSDIYPIIKDKIEFAKDNCKKLEEYHKYNNHDLHSVEANPYTEMYKVTDEFNKN